MPVKRNVSQTSGHHHQQPTMTRCRKCCYYCRQVTTFLFSHIGLGTLLLGYALAGALTFQALESEHEQQLRIDMLKTRNDMMVSLARMTNKSIVLHDKNWTNEAKKLLIDFEIKFVNAVKKKGYDGNEEMSKVSSQWSFSGSLLYSIIVITTIGYGNVAPRTDWGKVVTMLYAIIGIPLMLFCLSNIGTTMARSFKFIYWRCCCFLCVKPKKAQRQRRRIRRKIRKQKQFALIKQAIHQTSNNADQSLPNKSLPYLDPTPAYHSLTRSLSDRISSNLFTETKHTDNTASSNLSQNHVLLNTNHQSPKSMNSENFIYNQSNTLQVPRRINLSRSLSARNYNETKNQSQMKRNGTINKYHAPVICNNYASYSDECIDAFKKTSDLNCIAPQRIASQVRFQTLKDSINFIDPPSQTFHLYDSSNSIATRNQNNRSVFQSSGFDNPLNRVNTNHVLRNGPNSIIPTISYDLEFGNINKSLFDLSDSSSDSEDFDIQDKNIPITVCLALVVGYICGGAWFFSNSEDWTFLDASYFCFITLSTIGFGDLVPGRTVLSSPPEDGQITLAICALYLLFGMALLAMSLNLVKEKVLETVRIIGERIGILVNDDDDDYY